jgi:hypothetical protein
MLSSVSLMTNTAVASRQFLALDVDPSDAYRRFVSVTADGYSAATNRSYFDLPVTAGPVVQDSCQFCSHIAGDDTYMSRPICECCLSARESDDF